MNIRNDKSLEHAEAISCPPDSDLYAMFVYATAAVNLYGTISMDELCDIVNGYTEMQNGQAYDQRSGHGENEKRRAENEPDIIHMSRRADPDYMLLCLNWNANTSKFLALIELTDEENKKASRKYLISNSLMADDVPDFSEIKSILKSRKGIKRYTPSFEEFICYGVNGSYKPKDDYDDDTRVWEYFGHTENEMKASIPAQEKMINQASRSAPIAQGKDP